MTSLLAFRLRGPAAALRARLDRFLFQPASPRPLAYLRIGLGMTLLLQAFFLYPQAYELFGSGGIMQGNLGEYRPDSWFSLSRWTELFARMGAGEGTALACLFVLYACSLLCFLVGWRTRVASWVLWLTHLVLTHTQTTAYGLDLFVHIALFMVMWMPVGKSLSLDCWSDGDCDIPSWQARLSLRTIQIWLCIAYLASGVVKAIGEQWWNGEAIWRSLMLPTYMRFNFSWLASYPWTLRIAGLGTLVVEIGYPIFIWPRRTRKLWVGLTLGLHLGIAVFLQLHLFALVMCVLTFTMFGLSTEPGTKFAKFMDGQKWDSPVRPKKAATSSLQSPGRTPSLWSLRSRYFRSTAGRPDR